MINHWLTWKTIRSYMLQSGLLGDVPRYAVTGWYDGTLVSPERPNYIRVRFLDDNTEVEVYNDGVPAVSGIQVAVYNGYDNVLRAKHPSKNYSLVDFDFSFIKNHGPNHDYYSVDPTFFRVRSLLALQPHVVNKWDIRVRPGWIIYDGRPYWFNGETVPLKLLRPVTGARFVLLSAVLQTIDNVITVKIIVTNGIAKETVNAPDDFPTIPEGSYPICAVRLTTNRRQIYDKLANGDIHDLRLSGGGPSSLHNIASPNYHSSTATPGTLFKADSHGLPVDSVYTESNITSVFRKLEYHCEPVVYNGELLFFKNDIVVMEVHN